MKQSATNETGMFSHGFRRGGHLGCDGLFRRVQVVLGAVIGLLFLAGATAAPIWAQDYPNRPVRFILPFPPGGATDILGRIVSQKLSERLGQPYVPENQPGAGGIVGTTNVTKSRPDGYLIGLASGGAISVHMSAQKRHYDSLKDLAPISQVGAVRNVVIINPNLPVNNLQELIEYAISAPAVWPHPRIWGSYC